MSWDERREGWNQQTEDAREAADVDFARVIHSASFRRLQGKTQILNIGDSDFYRNRLTHSLEVSQVGLGLVRQLGKDYSTHACFSILPSSTRIQAICLTHDIGHPPFGHGGEIALNYCMRGSGGFEGNGQTLRILSRLEKFSQGGGANFSRRTLLGILKYPIAYSAAYNPKLAPCLVDNTFSTHILDRGSSTPPKCYLDTECDVVEWLLRGVSTDDKYRFTKPDIADAKKHRKSLHKSFDCSIMDVADDIGYGVHDFEDAVALKLVTQDQFREAVPELTCAQFLDALKAKYPGESANNVYDAFVANLFADGGSRKRQISRMVHHFVTNVEPYELEDFEDPILRFRVRIKAEVKPFLDALKGLVLMKVIRSANVQHLEFKGQQMVVAVFEALASSPATLLPAPAYEKYREANDVRVLCDYVAGMTDSYLLRTYERLFSPRMGSVFDYL